MAPQEPSRPAARDDADKLRDAPVGSGSNTGQPGTQHRPAGDGKEHYGPRTRGHPDDDLSGATSYGGLRSPGEQASGAPQPYSDWQPQGEDLHGGYGDHDDATDLYGSVGAGVRSAPPGERASDQPSRGSGSGSASDGSSAQSADKSTSSAASSLSKKP